MVMLFPQATIQSCLWDVSLFSLDLLTAKHRSNCREIREKLYLRGTPMQVAAIGTKVFIM